MVQQGKSSYLEITGARTLWEKRAMAYKAKLKVNVIHIWHELLEIWLVNCDDVDTYALQNAQ